MSAGADPVAADAVLGGWYAGEVGGEALFWRLAGLAEPANARRWLALAAIESRVAERLLATLLAHALPVPPTADSLEWAQGRAAAAAAQPWREQMAWLGRLAEEALEAMRREAKALPAPFAAIGALVVRHEAALLEFARAELAGDREGAERTVEEFLARTARA